MAMKTTPLLFMLLFIGCSQTVMSVREYEDWTIVVSDDVNPRVVP